MNFKKAYFNKSINRKRIPGQQAAIFLLYALLPDLYTS